MWRPHCLLASASLIGAGNILLLIFYLYGNTPQVRESNRRDTHDRVRMVTQQGTPSWSFPTQDVYGGALHGGKCGPTDITATEFPINPAGVCDEDVLLLILVHSLPRNDQMRSAVRNAYGKRYGKNVTRVLDRKVKAVFFCPGISLADTIIRRMSKESSDNNDLVHSNAANSTKANRPSSEAMLSEFRWVKTFCSSAKFILFANDGQFINVEALVQKMERRENDGLKNFHIGRVRKGARPNRSPEHREYVPESAFPGEQYPEFCIAGAGMVLSNAFIRNVYDSAVQFRSEVEEFPMSDILLGIVANKLNMTPMHDSKFREFDADMVYCELKDVLVLGGIDTPSQLTDAWANISSKKCPNPVPNATEIEKWTDGIDNGPYFEEAFRLLHNPGEICLDKDSGNRTFLLALVSTHPDHYELREAIRRTWAEPTYQTRAGVKTLFVLARSEGETPGEVERLRIESEENNDLIQAEFIEAYPNLTLKVILGLRWASRYCPGVPFVYKGDDDMMVNFEAITGHLRKLPPEDSKELFLGHLVHHSRVFRTGWKYNTPRAQYPFQYYVPYFSGGGYIMAQRVVQRMYQKARTTRLIPIDDAYAGILAFRAGVPLRHSSRVKPLNNHPVDSHIYRCRSESFFNMHGFQKAADMISFWEKFKTQTNGTCAGS